MSPIEQLGTFYTDSLVHSEKSLQLLVDVIGEVNILGCLWVLVWRMCGLVLLAAPSVAALGWIGVERLLLKQTLIKSF